MGTILVRYAEMGLKSRSVRKRFEAILVDNLMSAMVSADLEGLVVTEHGRIFIEAEEDERACQVLARVFGVSSLSPVRRCSSEIEDMKRNVSVLSGDLLSHGQSFAVRARRTGNHPYTSMDLGRELGSAAYLANQHKEVRVDLTSPDVEIFVEVREKRAYLFSSQISGPGGLPLGSQGKVIALLEEEKDALAAWMIMKRGCRAIAMAGEGCPAVDLLRAWDPKLRVIPIGDVSTAVRKHRALAAVFGYTLKDFQRMKGVDIPVPSFFPLVGMDEMEMEKRLGRIRG